MTVAAVIAVAVYVGVDVFTGTLDAVDVAVGVGVKEGPMGLVAVGV